MNTTWFDLAAKNAVAADVNASFDNNAPIVFGKTLEKKLKADHPELLFNGEFLAQVRKECLLRNYLNDRAPFAPVPEMSPAYYIQETDVTEAIEALSLARTSKAKGK